MPLLTTLADSGLSAFGFSRGGGSQAAFELIATTAGTGSSGNITFSSIPGTYKHLQLRWTAKNTANNSPTVKLRFNSDTGSNYARHVLRGEGSGSPLVYQASSQTAIDLFYATSYNVGTSVYATGVLDILDYAQTTKNKTVRTFFGVNDASTGTYVNIGSGLWNSTAAVTSLSFNAEMDSFTTASRFSLYGIRG